MSEQPPLFEPRRHGHLRLAAAMQPGSRQPRSPGYGGSTTYSDRASHGGDLDRQVSNIKDAHKRRSAVLGVDPELILVLETNGPLDPAVVERAGLRVLEIRSDRALVAFAADPDLTEFMDRNEKYREGTRGLTEKGNERRAQYEDLFDLIDTVRTVEERDLIGAELSELMTSMDEDAVHRLEVHCWCPEDEQEARRRNDDVAEAVKTAGGVVHQRSVRPIAGWSAICCDVPFRSIGEILATERVSWVNVMPRPILEVPQLLHTTPESLPLVLPPPGDAPIVAVIDSGLRSAHPLIAPAVAGVEFVGEGLGDGGDESGHGTLVASIALYGSMEERLASGEALTPAGRLLSVRVLNRDDKFQDDVAWPDTLMEAMEVAAEGGARVINLSIGDDRRPYQASRPTAIAALVDQFVRDHPGIVVVTCAGNYSLDGHDTARLMSNEYVQDLLASTLGGLLDPGTAALSVTTGGLGAGYAQGVGTQPSAERVPVGGPRLPSPFSRVGPGPMGAIKPEIAASSGSVMVDTLYARVVNDRSVQVVGAGGQQPDRLLAASHGTSFAAPLVSHAALRILRRYPSLTGNSVRALLLVGSEALPDFLSGGNAQSRIDQRRLVGYGRVSAERAESSDDHRVVLLGESSLTLDQVHFYRVPLPSSFRQSGGSISITVALAFDPPVRVTRLDYLANKMSFQLFHGTTVADVRAAYVRAESEQGMQEDVDLSPSELRRFQLDLQPSDRERSRGTNQLGRYGRSTKIPDDKPDEMVLAVRSLNRWDSPGATQDYSLAIALERDPQHGEIYAELRVELEPLVEVEVELEAER